MNLGKMRERCEILSQKIAPGNMGQKVYNYDVIGKRRGNWRASGGREFLLANAPFNIRTGTLLTHYYPDADEKLFIRINGKDIYNILSFSHSDDKRSTIWTLEFLVPHKIEDEESQND